MDVRLYLLEILVSKIDFKNGNVYSGSDLLVVAELKNFFYLEIQSVSQDAKASFCNVGKSSLFPGRPGELYSAISAPLEMKLLAHDGPLGVAVIPWSSDFSDMIKISSQKSDLLPPAQMEGTFEVLTEQLEAIGTIAVKLRITCFGNNIRTQFQLMEEEASSRKVIMKFRNLESTFQCQKVGSGGSLSDLLPIGPLMNVVHNPKPDTGKSWMALYLSSVSPKPSENPNLMDSTVGGGGGGGGAIGVPDDIISLLKSQTVSCSTFDVVSIYERPNERKFTYLPTKSRSGGFIMDDTGSMTTFNGSAASAEECPDELTWTKEQINEMLCTNCDCPAALKFKEFGLGPLAKDKNGLGGMYEPVDLPIVYGISHTYGTLCNYGPYGLYQRPRKPTEPFVPRDIKECDCDPLRLTGGGFDYGEIKSPLDECKDIMGEADALVQSFKEALGPCGEVVCPFNMTLMRQKCKEVCHRGTDDPTYVQTMAELKPPSYEPDDSVRGKFNACGSPQCAYTKYKTGLVDEDAVMELQFLPAPRSRCKESCPYQPVKDLPPIHWECPDPLPSGNCKNPRCPYVPRDLKGICDKTKPPPPPPSCCFNIDCPMMKQFHEAMCSNPDCPFKPPPEVDVMCGNPDCPAASGKAPPPKVDCQNPDCPYNANASMNSEQPSVSVCSNPDCPFAQREMSDESCCHPGTKHQKREPPQGPCGNPTCPFVSSVSNEEDSLCSNLSCPYRYKEPEPPKPICPPPVPCMPPICGFPAPCMPCPLPCRMPCQMPCYPQILDICPLGQCPYSKAPKPDLNFACLTPCSPPPPPSQTTPQEEDQESTSVCPGCCQKKPEPKPCCGTTPTCVEKHNAYQDQCKDQSSIDYTSETRSLQDQAPCRIGTCRATGGDLACAICRGCPCIDKRDAVSASTAPSSQPAASVAKRPCCSAGGDSGETQLKDNSLTDNNGIEYTSDTRVDIDGAPCKPGTCLALGDGGTLECDECHQEGEPCPCAEQKSLSSKAARSKGDSKDETSKRSRRKGKFVYHMGNKYPGVLVGHRECVEPAYNVPPKMGWLWNIYTPILSLKPRRGWRPGAITNTIANRIREHHRQKGLSKFVRPRFGGRGRAESDDDEVRPRVKPKPTLQIKKKDGCYLITMNPLKDPKTLAPNENPYIDCTPMQFKIVKNRPPKEECVEGCPGADNYRTCCLGDNGDIKQVPESSSSDSELDIEFTPPAGIIRPELFKRKRNVVHTDTQYNPNDYKKLDKKKSTGKMSNKSSKKGKKKGGGGGKKGGAKGKGGKK